MDPENRGLAVGISFLSCVEVEIISDYLMYLRFSKILPVCGCHIGYPVMNWSEIFTSPCTTNIFMKSHGSIPVNSWLQNNINKFGLGVIYPAPPP
jgi:hypothetical protein